MALLKRLLGGESDSDQNDEIDYWAVRWMPWDGDGGYRILEEWDELEDPITRDVFELNVDDPKPGRYRLFALRDNKYVKAPEEHRWKYEVGEPSESEPESDTKQPAGDLQEDLDRIQNQLEELEEQRQALMEDPELVTARLRAQVLLQAVQSPEFMGRYGDKIALAAFDALDMDQSKPDFEDWQETPLAAWGYEFAQLVSNEPQKLEEMGLHLGAGIGEVMDGWQTRNGDTRTDFSSNEFDQQKSEETTNRDSEPDEDSRPMTLADVDGTFYDVPRDNGSNHEDGTEDSTINNGGDEEASNLSEQQESGQEDKTERSAG